MNIRNHKRIKPSKAVVLKRFTARTTPKNIRVYAYHQIDRYLNPYEKH